MSDDAHRIIVVEDDDDLREMVIDYFRSQGYVARGAASGRDLDEALRAEEADLLLIDLNLPKEDGLSISRRLRATSNIPIIMVTGANDVVDRIVGLEVGADDYVTKPFDLRELKARIRAVMRRHAATAMQPPGATPFPLPQPSATVIAFGTAYLDLEGHCLIRPNGVREELTAMEFDLLRVLAHNPNRVLTRDRLLDLAHNRDNEPFDRSIDVRITRLRKKVEADPSRPQTIKTIRGTGYMFSPNRHSPVRGAA